MTAGLGLAEGIETALAVMQRAGWSPVWAATSAGAMDRFAARLLLLREALGDAGEAFRYIAQRATVGPPVDDLEDVIAAARDMGADVIVLDTLARTFGECDENAARDMGGFVANVDRLRTETGAHVAVIHHGTKEGGSAKNAGARNATLGGCLWRRIKRTATGYSAALPKSYGTQARLRCGTGGFGCWARVRRPGMRNGQQLALDPSLSPARLFCMSKSLLLSAVLAAVSLQPTPATAQGDFAGSGRAFERWPSDLAERARAIHRSFCIDLGLILPFQGGQDACERLQEYFLPIICTPQGRSRVVSGAPNCLPELEQDVRASLHEVRYDLGINRSPGRISPPLQARPQPPTAQAGLPPVASAPSHSVGQSRLDPMPRSYRLEGLAPREVFAEVRSAIWVLVAVSPESEQVSQGSAVAVSPRHLLTTCHVVEGMTALGVVQGSIAHAVSVSLSDPTTDRCVLEIAQAALRPIRAVRPASGVEVGERVYSIAAPAGLELTLGEGLVSALRSLDGMPVIQTTALISPGSSGGALIDAGGNLIGIIGSRLRSAPAIGFAIGADSLWSLAR